MLSGYYTYKVLEAAGLPGGVINFLPGNSISVPAASVSMIWSILVANR